MNIKETFLKFTEYTIPFGYEEKLIPLLKEYVPNLQKDSVGNYFVSIGYSETLFTTHLDTYSNNYEKVNHIIDGNWIKTDGTTILGGDNKNGLVILLYLIEQNVPGTYYFFIGEEPIISGGLYGSTKALEKNPEFFKKFKRAIAFDRKEIGSIVTRQLARKCCSDEFAEYIINEIKTNSKLLFKKDPKAYYTDTATFLDIIPECTNISAGGWGEHTKNEKSLITYIEYIAKSASKINWEKSPVVRIPQKVSSINKIKRFNNYNKQDYKKTKSNFQHIDYFMENFNFLCLNKHEFNVGVDLIYSNWHDDIEIIIKIIGNNIYVDNNLIGNLTNFKKMLNIKFNDYVNIEEITNDILSIKKNKITKKEMDKILKQYHTDSDELIEYLNNYEKLNYLLKFENNIFKINIL